MACFLAPLTVAVGSSVIKNKVPKKLHFNWLVLMLWGGVIMSIADHIVNGEITLHFPFFTRGGSFMLEEIIKVGIPMTLSVIGIWIVMVAISMLKERKEQITKGQQA